MKECRRWLPLVPLLLVVCAPGCNRGPAMGKVSGSVSLDGTPLKFGSVMFQNVSGGQPSVGEIQPDGSFVLSTFRPEDGAIVGNHKVRVVCYSTQDPANKRSGPMGDSLGALLIPRKYASLGTSGLSAEVTAEGLEDFKIELSSKGPGR